MSGPASKRKQAGAKGRRLGSEERRAQLIRIASRQFRSQPYDAVSLDEIAAEAGISRGLITHYFGTKRELYLEVVRRLIRVPEIPVPAFVQGATPRSRLDESLTGWLEAIDENRAIYFDALALAGSADPELAGILEGARETMVRRMAEVLGLGPFEELSNERVGLLFIWEALAEGAIRQWIQHGRLDRGQVHQVMLETGGLAAEGLLDELAAQMGEGSG